MEKTFDDEKRSYALLREEFIRACSPKREIPPTEEESKKGG